MVQPVSTLPQIRLVLMCLLAAATAAADPGPRVRVGI